MLWFRTTRIARQASYHVAIHLNIISDRGKLLPDFFGGGNIFTNRFRELRSGWSILLSFGGMLAGQILAGIVLSAVLIIQMTITASGQNMSASVLASSPVILTISNTFPALACILLFKVVYRRPLSQMGLSKNRIFAQLLSGGTFGILSIALVWGTACITGLASVVSVSPSILAQRDFWLSFIMFIAVGFGEEILCRGYIMTALKTTRNRIVIFFGPSLIFSLLHLGNPNVSFISLINIFLIGVLFAYLLTKTGNLWMAIGYHITWNFFQGNIFGLNVSGIETISLMQTRLSGPDLLTGGSFGAEGGLITTIVILSSLLFIHFAIKPAQNIAWTFASDLPFYNPPKHAQADA